MIHFDVTSRARSSHSSGLLRVSRRLHESLGDCAQGFCWAPARPPSLGTGDWVLSPELFSPEERPGFLDFLKNAPARKAAIFHDAIPLRLPHITWPRSVARHPAYLKMLAEFDLVLAVSEASRQELLGFWRWLGIKAG